MGNCYSCCFLSCTGHYTEYKFDYNEKLKDSHSPSCWPCAATGLYMLLPSARKGSDKEALRRDAKALRDAMKGAGTDDSELARVLCARTPQQVQIIRQIFEEEYGDSQSLADWIKDDTSGDWKNLLLMWQQDPAVRDAELIHETLDGVGTADAELQTYLITRSPEHIRHVKAEYEKLYKRTLADDIRGDTSFNYKQVLLVLLARAEYLAERLHKGIARAGTDDARLIRILTSIPRSNAHLRSLLSKFEDHFNTGIGEELEYELSMPDLQDVKAAYQRLYNTTLEKDVASDTSGNFRRMCLELLRDPAESTADHFHEAMDGKVTNDNMLIEVCTSRPPSVMHAAAAMYEQKHGKPLEKSIESATSGDYLNTLLGLVRPRAQVFAQALRVAFEGIGTDDNMLMATVVGRGREELKEIAESYEHKYGESLEDGIKSETSFWYKRALVYAIRQAHEEFIRVPHDQLVRLRDM